MRVLLPSPVTSVGADQLAELYAYPPSGALRANMVTTLDGAVAADGRTEVISGASDKHVFALLRALADVVIVGAGTARAEQYGPVRERAEFTPLRKLAGQPPTATLAILTRAADLDPTSRLFSTPSPRPIVLTCERAPRQRRTALAEVAEVEICGDQEVDLAVALRLLRDRGLNNVLCEGGPRLLGDVAAAGLLDELALSTSPVVAGGEAGRIVSAKALILQYMNLRTLLEADDFLFALYERRRSEKTA